MATETTPTPSAAWLRRHADRLRYLLVRYRRACGGVARPRRRIELAWAQTACATVPGIVAGLLAEARELDWAGAGNGLRGSPMSDTRGDTSRNRRSQAPME